MPNRLPRRALLCPTMLLLVLLLPACAGFHLYDADREKAAQTAKKTFESASVEGTVTAARKNTTALTDAEVEQARRIVELRRDLLLLAIAGDQPCNPQGQPTPNPNFYNTYLACLDRELALLVGTAQAPAVLRTTLTRATADVRSGLAALFDDRTKFLLLFKGIPPPPCTGNQPPSPDLPPLLRDAVVKAAPDAVAQLPTLYRAYTDDCGAYLTALNSILQAAAPGSALGTAVTAWLEGQEGLAKAKGDAALLKQQYDEALDAYNKAAVRLSTDASQAVRAAAKDALDKATAAANALEGAANMLGTKTLSEDRLKQLDVLIGALKGDTLDPAKYDDHLRRSLSAVSTLPAFADRALDIVHSQAAPPLGSLILSKELQEVRLAAATRQVQRADQRLSLLEDRVNGYRDQTIAILDARDQLTRANQKAPNLLNASAVTAFSASGPSAARVDLLQSILTFADAFSIPGTAAAEAEYRLVALEYEASLDRSEDAVKEWERLIAVPIDRLTAFYGSGIKAETLASIITQALGLGLIGVGVNR